MTLSISSREIKEIIGMIDDSQLDQVHSFVIFVGHAHSGHSIIGALLDAHPEVAISNEMNVPKLILDHDLNEETLQKLVLSHTLNHSLWVNTGYKYHVENAYQGKTRFPKVLGDKKGGGSTRIIRNNPWVLDRLHEIFADKLKFINVVRNPKDNIAAFAHYWGDTEVTQKHVDRYLENLETTTEIEKRFPNHFFRLEHSDFIENPVNEYMKILHFFFFIADMNQVTNWLSLVRKKENKRSETIIWRKDINFNDSTEL